LPIRDQLSFAQQSLARNDSAPVGGIALEISGYGISRVIIQGKTGFGD
jgi:hypothetical protein